MEASLRRSVGRCTVGLYTWASESFCTTHAPSVPSPPPRIRPLGSLQRSLTPWPPRELCWLTYVQAFEWLTVSSRLNSNRRSLGHSISCISNPSFKPTPATTRSLPLVPPIFYQPPALGGPCNKDEIDLRTASIQWPSHMSHTRDVSCMMRSLLHGHCSMQRQG